MSLQHSGGSALSMSYSELHAHLRGYIAACRHYDRRLVVLFVVALAPALETVFASYILHRTWLPTDAVARESFALIWASASVVAVVALAAYILLNSGRFRRDMAPRCPRCTCEIRNADDFMMAMAIPELRARTAPVFTCDACDHVIATGGTSVFAQSQP